MEFIPAILVEPTEIRRKDDLPVDQCLIESFRVPQEQVRVFEIRSLCAFLKKNFVWPQAPEPKYLPMPTTGKKQWEYCQKQRERVLHHQTLLKVVHSSELLLHPLFLRDGVATIELDSMENVFLGISVALLSVPEGWIPKSASVQWFNHTYATLFFSTMEVKFGDFQSPFIINADDMVEVKVCFDIQDNWSASPLIQVLWTGCRLCELEEEDVYLGFWDKTKFVGNGTGTITPSHEFKITSALSKAILNL